MDLPDKTQAPREKKKPVIGPGEAKPTERAARRRLMDFVIAESPKTVIGSVAKQTLLPESKRVLEVVLQNILHGVLWSNGSVPSTGGGPIVRGTVIRGNGVVLNSGGIDYSSLSSPQAQAAAVAAGGSMTGPYKDLTFQSSASAEAVYASVVSDLNQYNVVTVADLYEAANLTPGDGHSNLGWYSLDGARIVQDRDGVKLMLPKPVRV